MSTVVINTIAVMFYSGNYAGVEPPYDIPGLKAGDLAQDTSCGVLWEYDGEQWLRRATNSGAKIFLNGPANSIREYLANDQTVVPSFMECYAGDDDNVPDSLRLTAEDLVIHHKLGNPPIIYAHFMSGDDCVWRVVKPANGSIVTDNYGEWSSWVGFTREFIPHNVLISVVDIGHQNIGGYIPPEPSSESSDSSDSSESSEEPEPVGRVWSVNGQVGDVVLDAEDVGALSNKGQPIQQLNSTSLVPSDSVAYHKVLEDGDEFIIDSSAFTVYDQVDFELHLVQPSTAVSFTLPSNMWWSIGETDEMGKVYPVFSPSVQPPVMGRGNSEYCIVARWDGSNFLCNLAYIKTLS